MCALAVVGDGFFDVRQAQLISIAHDGHHQATRAAHCHPYIVVAVIDDVVAVDRGIDQRKFFERIHRCLDEERHEAQLYAMLLLELVFVAVTQINHRLHVDFVERSQYGRRGLRLNQALRHARAQARHGHTLFGAITQRTEVNRRRWRT